MSVMKSQQKTESHKNELLFSRARPSAKSVRFLKFRTGDRYYAVEMNELKRVIRDLVLIQSSTPQSVTARFIKRNRRQTIVFNLELCLDIEKCTMTNEGKTSIIILNEIISGFPAAVLVPGIPEILKMNYPLQESDKNSYAGNSLSVCRIIKNAKPGTSNTADEITLIDIRNLVDNCIVRLKYGEAEGIAGQVA